MKKGFNKILIILMSVALIGLIIIQFYWTQKVFVSHTEEFNGRVYQAMNATVEEINQQELQLYYKRFETVHNDLKASADKPQVMSSQLIQDSAGTTYITLTRYILERSVVPLSEEYDDSLISANLYSQEKVVRIPKDSGANMIQNLSLDTEENFKNSTYTIERLARLDAGNRPIGQRLDINVLDSIFTKQLRQRGVQSHPQLAVLTKDSAATKVATSEFDLKDSEYTIPIFYDNNDKPQYLFTTYFPDKQLSILGPIIPIVMLTIIFTIIIISVFSLAIYYMQLQRKISEIKTDFINNMTHEFKTPIATINIASDALKNDKIISDHDRIRYYADLIKQENKRMNTQVEMVLRMAKLERNQVDINLQELNINDLVGKSVSTMRFIIDNLNGTIFEEYNASRSVVDGDAFHLENTINNILDNARKYSQGNPQIFVRTYNEDENIVIEVKDKGMGMSKTVLKKIFDQFYREETGNVHNVKGHGLGLAYVRKIVELHKGQVYAESETGKGSTFYIKLPLK
ncbi:MAG TPA: HAMP domain-containing sensor histidine kinase [Moheibacter sp.]|nr:HAMP domain-containing sensor histidine kinase [Moheibacter sp.]